MKVKTKDEIAAIQDAAQSKKELQQWANETRAKIRGGSYFKRWEKVADKLFREYQTLSTTEITALRASANEYSKIVGKALPDLKSIDTTITVEGEVSHTHELEKLSNYDLQKLIDDARSDKPEGNDAIDAEYTEIESDN